jgi:hypothetical protein
MLGWMRRLPKLFKRTAQLLLHEVVFGRHDGLVQLLSCLHLCLVPSDIPVLISFSLSSRRKQNQASSIRILMARQLGWLKAGVGG